MILKNNITYVFLFLYARTINYFSSDSFLLILLFSWLVTVFAQFTLTSLLKKNEIEKLNLENIKEKYEVSESKARSYANLRNINSFDDIT